MIKKIALIASMTFGTMLSAAGITTLVASSGPAVNFHKYPYAKKCHVNNLTKEEISALKYMYEEEKLAKDVYYVLHKMYPGIRVFNIYKAEAVHEKSVDNVLKHYCIDMPAKSDKIGQFNNPELKKLYNVLVAKGRKSLGDALEVGIMIEVTDINDLNKYLSKSVHKDIKALFSFLRQGSYNHYNAFNYMLKRVIGKDACRLMSKQWCHKYPFERGIGVHYRNWYWFSGKRF